MIAWRVSFEALGQLGDGNFLPMTQPCDSTIAGFHLPTRQKPAPPPDCLLAVPLRPLCKILLDIFHLLCPAALISAERFQHAITGNLVKA